MVKTVYRHCFEAGIQKAHAQNYDRLMNIKHVMWRRRVWFAENQTLASQLGELANQTLVTA